MDNWNSKIEALIIAEEKRQNNTITLIASENYAPRNVLYAQGSKLTNKYIEGYPKNRYYGGCEIIDEIEELAILLAKKIFNADHVNVHPHSGSQANTAAYLAILNPGDRVLAMALDSGGHLTHGHQKNFSGMIYDFHHYSVNQKSELLDYDELEKIARKTKPKLIVAGASSYSRIIDFKKIGQIARKVNAYFLADIAHIAGLIVAKIHPSPVPYADIVTLTTHKTLRGARGGLILCKEYLKKRVDAAVFPGTQGGSIGGAIAGKAYVFAEALTPDYIDYQKKVVKCCKHFAKSFKKGRIVSGGTDNHQFTIDVFKSYGLNGKQCCEMLEEANVITNKNLIPFDPLPSSKCSGLRLGTAACVTRGMGEKDFEKIAYHMEELFICQTRKAVDSLKKYVKELCRAYPVA